MDETIDVPLDGEPRNTLTVRLRSRSDGKPTYQARRIIPVSLRQNQRNPYVTKSLGTDDYDRAVSMARQWERKLFVKIDSGEPIKDVPFEDVARSYLVWISKRAEVQDRSGEPLANQLAIRREETSITRYLIPFFGKTDVRRITTGLVEKYVEWRLDYYVDGPGAKETEIAFVLQGKILKRPLVKNARPAPSTINKDAVAFSKVIDHARRSAGVRPADVPRIQVPRDRKQKTRRRARFSDSAWELLAEKSQERSAWNDKRTDHFRFVLWGYLQFLRGTGVRVSEANWIQVKHLKMVPVQSEARSTWVPEEPEFGGPAFDGPLPQRHRDQEGRLLELRVQVTTDDPGLKQADHARMVIPTLVGSFALFHYLDFLIYWHNETFGTHFQEPSDLPGNLYLFIDPAGKRIASMKGSFDRLLAAAVSDEFPNGLKVIDGQSMSLSCIRHTYASKQIEAGAAKNGVGGLADNMGTSTEMIRRHYGQALHELRVAELQLE